MIYAEWGIPPGETLRQALKRRTGEVFGEPTSLDVLVRQARAQLAT